MPKGNKICPDCSKKLVYIREPRCKKCSKPIEFIENEYCVDCQHSNFAYTYGLSLWAYNKYIKHSIANFKNNNKREFADYYIDEIIKVYGDKIRSMNIDALVPVPLHKSKYMKRGYNQAEILAKGISDMLNIKLISDLIIREKKTLSQKDLNDRDRFKNLQSAFRINDNKYKSYSKQFRNIMLVDDIYTTGSTIESCSKVLLSYGVEKIYFITLSIGKGY